MHITPANPATDRLACTWYESGKNGLTAKRVSVILMGTIGTLTPLERFNTANTPILGITKAPATGVGDEAFFMVSQLRVSIHLSKGNSVFELMVGGLRTAQVEQVKTMEKTLAQEVVAKL
jgi:hypothetical protein